MFLKSVKKVADKIKEGTENSKAPLINPVRHNFRRKATFTVICILTFVLLVAIPGVGSDNFIVYSGSVKGHGTGVYWDQTCINKASSLDLGLIQAGSNNTSIVYVKNEGKSAHILLLETLNWTPATSSDYISLTWNYSGQVINVGQVIPLQLTLTTYPTIKGISSFSFDTIITSTS